MTREDKFKQLYIAVNEMMAFLGAYGEIDTRNATVDEVMNALHELDDGVYKVERVFPECAK